MVEFALVAPFFFLVLFGIIEGGRFVFYYEMLNNAAREGARYAVVHGGRSVDPTGPPHDPTGSDVKQAVESAALGLAASGDLFVHDPVWTPAGSTPPRPGDASTGTNARGNYVSVFVTYTYDPVIPVLPPITISAESTLVVNN